VTGTSTGTETDAQPPATTADVIERLRAAVESGQNEQFISQFAPDAVYETPFGLDGPKRWEGFEAISELLVGGESTLSICSTGADQRDAQVRGQKS